MKPALLRSFTMVTLLAHSQIGFSGTLFTSAKLTDISFSTLSGSASSSPFSQNPIDAATRTSFDNFDNNIVYTDPASDGVNYDALSFDYGSAEATNDVIGNAFEAVTMLNGNYTVDAAVHSELIIELTGTGIFEINIAYELLIDPLNNGPEAQAVAYFYSGSDNSNEKSNLAQLAITGPEIAGNTTKSISGEHTLTFEIDTIDPIRESIALYAYTGSSATASVPDPTAIWLMIPGLVGLIYWPRKRPKRIP